ncbi:amino acid permease/ SLC12A domain-containing protein [Ustulina deusta]|nr:amino acid permease/ SLC12A domain-containing protein [Ustulina deusta]
MTDSDSSPGDHNTPSNDNNDTTQSIQPTHVLDIGIDPGWYDGRASGVKRRLKPVQIFMITLNATLGIGLYWRCGQVLELGGPVAVLVSFGLITILAWTVMQCISEMLCRWPVPGALSEYVSQFVDFELGIAVGIMYWLTYSVGFAALIATSAGEIRYWIRKEPFDIIVIYIVIPLILVGLNRFQVGIYGWFEVVFGSLKLMFFLVIILAMVVLSAMEGSQDATEHNWNDTTAWDQDASPSRGPAFLMAIATAVFAYVGLEVVAACALEAEPPKEDNQADPITKSKRPGLAITTKFSAVWTSALIGVAYIISGVLATFPVERDDCRLPRPGWLPAPQRCNDMTEQMPTTSSVFVLAARLRDRYGLAHAFNTFLVFTALTCANTNLYIASRALYGLVKQLGRSKDRFLNFLLLFGETSAEGVPFRAVVFSAAAFGWVPFLQLQGYDQNNPIAQATASPSAGITTFIDILSEISSVGVIIVWACECVAFLRYRHFLVTYEDSLRERGIPYLDRKAENYPYRSHAQPLIAYLALAGCTFVLLGANQASLWNGFYVEPFLSSFLAIFIFLLAWVILKVYRRKRLRLADFFDVVSSSNDVPNIFLYLSDLANQ